MIKIPRFYKSSCGLHDMMSEIFLEIYKGGEKRRPKEWRCPWVTIEAGGWVHALIVCLSLPLCMLEFFYNSFLSFVFVFEELGGGV
jgi:hypothetical protein